MKIVETVSILGWEPSLNISESVEVPNIIYPEIRAITSNTITRNKTFYPRESLIGDESKGNGIYSLLYPYPKPIIKDHSTGSGIFSGEASPIYGRVKCAKFVPLELSKGYVSTIAEITDEEAIRKILSERFLTVSIGVDTESVTCSVCNTEFSKGDQCDHVKGQTYYSGNKPQECYWIIGPVTFEEISFVTVPSDVNAKVINKDTGSFGEMNLVAAKYKDQQITFDYKKGSESFKHIWGFPSKEIFTRIEESLNPLTEKDIILTLGELYFLPEDDEDFNKESKLTTKQRKSLSDSDFCGPSRQFPVPDLSHAVQGLRMLSRYKGPGDKSKIKSCLLRKAAQFKKKEALGGESLATLKDKKYGIEFPLFICNKDNIFQVLDAIETSNFPQKIQLKENLYNFCNLKNIDLPEQLKKFNTQEKNLLDSSYQDEALKPLIIDLNEETYPLLYNIIDVMEQYIMNNVTTETQEKDKNPKQGITVESTVSEESIVTDTKEHLNQEENSKETKILPDENKDSSLVEKVESIEEKRLKESVLSLESENKILRESSIEAYSELHKTISEQAGLLAMVLKKPIAKDKTLEAVSQEYSKRSTSSLKDTISDLLMEMIDSKKSLITHIDTTKVEKIENPVLQEDNTNVKTKLIVDPTTGQMTVDSEITEEDDETIIAHFGLTEENLKKRIQDSKLKVE